MSASRGLVELQKYMAVSKYARYLEAMKRRETWTETADRYRGMLLEKYPHRADAIDEVCGQIVPMNVMPSMRGLQYGGKPIFKHNAKLYNCSGSYCDRLRFFAEAFYMLLCGSGVGTSVQERHIKHLPGFSYKRRHGVTLPRKVYQPPDSIEGWADSVSVLLSSFHEDPIKGFEEYHDCDVEFDLGLIRERGSKLSFGVGKAPGPVPLMKCLTRTAGLFNRAMASGLDRMDSITAFDAFMHTADAGVSGGVRRSATIVVFDFWDRLMRTSKTGPWRAKNKQRERANISALCQRGGITFEQFQEVFEATRQWGEPGFYWSSHPDMLPNPCVEIGFLAKLLVDPTTDDGHRLLKNYQGPIYRHDSRGDSLADETDATWGNKVCLSGWQMCNVTTMNGRTIQSEEDFYERCKYASLLGTWQAGFDKFPYLGEVSEKIVQREALLGVSICGMMHNPDLLFNPDVQRKGAFIVVRTNEEEAKLIGVNPSARTTCIKPDGNSASTLGSFSGVHPGKFKKGFRIVQASNNEAPYMHLRSVNPQACERHNSHTDVIRFCVEYKGKMEGDMTACEFLDYVKTTQINWVGGGKVKERCTEPWLSNNVSNTVRVRDSEWHAVAKKIYDNQEHYSGVSLISVYGDRDYQNAPFTSVYDEDEQAKTYGAAAASLEKDNLLRGSCVFANLWEACDLVLGLWGEGRTPSLVQANWAHDLTYFAGEYLNGDIRSATYCLKDAHNWALYVRLKESYVEVDYAEMVEEDNGINFQAEAGCAGGACET